MVIKEGVKRVPILGPAAKKLYFYYGRWIGSNKLRRQLNEQSTIRLVVGAEGNYKEGWLPTGRKFLDLLKPEDWYRFFEHDSIDVILAEHVWEHLSYEQGVRAAQTCAIFLKPGGYVRAAVPDGLHPDPDYIEWVKIGGVGPAADDHKMLYIYDVFRKVFEQAGLEVTLLEYFDEDGHFNYHEWNPDDGYIRRSKRFDKRNQNEKLHYTSIILDAVKVAPGAGA